MSTIGHEKIFWTTNETFSLQQPPFAQNTKYLFESNTEWPLKSCCLHSSLGFKGQRAWKSFNIPASHLSTWWTDQRLPTPSEAHNWPARESETMWRQPDATPRRTAAVCRGLMDSEEHLKGSWGRNTRQGGLRVGMLHWEGTENWRVRIYGLHIMWQKELALCLDIMERVD